MALEVMALTPTMLGTTEGPAEPCQLLGLLGTSLAPATPQAEVGRLEEMVVALLKMAELLVLVMELVLEEQPLVLSMVAVRERSR